VIYQTHTVVRRRVIGHCIAKLNAWQHGHVRANRIRATRTERERLQSVWASYQGHFAHARSYRLRERIFRRYRWLEAALAAAA